jgi:uncharacterized protein YecE (DUF72 family)
MQLWLGTSGFQYPEWKGKFYPADLSTGKMLAYYASRFTSTEVNYTFRRIPSANAVERWAAGTPEHFKFSFKAPQKVTHIRKLRDCAEVMEIFAGALSPMGAKLGAVLFQLPPTLKKDVALLEDFLPQIPAPIRGAFEFRHDSWFEDAVYDVLRRHGAALCLAESEDLSTPKEVTAGFGYLRLRREDYQKADLKKWADFVTARRLEWSDAFVYFKHEERAVGPEFAAQFLAMVPPGPK